VQQPEQIAMQFQTAMLASAAVAFMHDHRLDERPNRVARYRFCTARAERPVSGLEDEFGFERRLTGVPEELDRRAAKWLISQSNHGLKKSPWAALACFQFVEKAGQ
jgi:hypothetical protein